MVGFRGGIIGVGTDIGNVYSEDTIGMYADRTQADQSEFLPLSTFFMD
jgi:hypothetical protein